MLLGTISFAFCVVSVVRGQQDGRMSAPVDSRRSRCPRLVCPRKYEPQHDALTHRRLQHSDRPVLLRERHWLCEAATALASTRGAVKLGPT